MEKSDCLFCAHDRVDVETHILEYMVAGPYHGFGGHEEAVERIHCWVVPKLHRHRRLVLQLKTKLKRVKDQSLYLSGENNPVSKHSPVFKYLFVGTCGHVSAHVEVSRWVDKHNLESIVEFCNGRLQAKEKGTEVSGRVNI